MRRFARSLERQCDAPEIMAAGHLCSVNGGDARPDNMARGAKSVRPVEIGNRRLA
jgi:hypothetical protein